MSAPYHYPTDLTDDQWALLSLYLPEPKWGSQALAPDNDTCYIDCSQRLGPHRAKESLGEEDGASTFETSHRNPVGHQSHPVRVSHPPEASLASSSVMAARSVDSECKSRVIEPRNKGWSQEPSPLGSRGQHRLTVMAW